jgi:hypothetical protein
VKKLVRTAAGASTSNTPSAWLHCCRAAPRTASKSQPGISASRLATAPASLTGEIATLTMRSAPAAVSKSNTPTSCRPSTCARRRAAQPPAAEAL